jgi:hypothetical protein
MHLTVCEKRIDSFAQKLSGAVGELGYTLTIGERLCVMAPDIAVVCSQLRNDQW